MNQFPYIRKTKMAANSMNLCDICHKVWVPATKAKVQGNTVCVHCRSKNEKRLYDDQRYKNVGRPRKEQKRVLSENKTKA